MNTVRGKVLEKGVEMESAISQLFIVLLDNESEKSISFGNTSSALGLNAKVNLLIDLDFLDKALKPKFQKFMEIRNKFAHLHYVDSFEKCFEFVSGEKDFLKQYTKDYSDEVCKEIKLGICFDFLCSELSIWLRLSLMFIREKLSNDLKKNVLIEVLRDYKNQDSENQELNRILNLVKEIQPDEKLLKLIEIEKRKN